MSLSMIFPAPGHPVLDTSHERRKHIFRGDYLRCENTRRNVFLFQLAVSVQEELSQEDLP